jgi:ATP adenylyltransferase
MAFKKRLINVSHARSAFQRDVMQRIAKDKVCPFCEEHFLKYHTRPILKKGKYWILTENFVPYEGAKHHLMIVSRTHIEHFSELIPAARAELFDLFADECKKRGIRGGSLVMRFGDTDYTGGSVAHLHAHMVSGAKRGTNRSPLTAYLGYKTTAPAQARSRRPRS